MTNAIVEAVPNFSEGRDPDVVQEIAAAIRSVEAVDVVSETSDPDHHRSVITYLGPPDAVLEASVRAARAAVDRIDMTRHEGVHPRIGAIDVLPFVPLLGVDLQQVADLARRAGHRIADEIELPVYFYAHASDPAGRELSSIRRVDPESGLPGGEPPDLASARSDALHPTAGAVCVGARNPLLAWNVYLEGNAELVTAQTIAARIRESGGGFPGLKALGFHLSRQDRVQVSMNLESPHLGSAAEVYRTIDEIAREHGARAGETEVIGLIPDDAASAAAAAFLQLRGADRPDRLLSRRLVGYLERHGSTGRP